MVKVLVVGAAGRMGKTIISCLNDTAGVQIGGGTETVGNPMIGKDIGEVAGIGAKGIPIYDSLEKALPACDVMIDFSSPESSLESLRLAVKLGKAVVVGTTGFSPAQNEEIRRLCQNVRCVMAPNMSIGVNVLFKVVHDMAKTLGDAYDIEIVEAHHKFKKDAPSGTAVRISEIVASALDRKLTEVGIYGRKGITQGRPPKEIGIHTLRAGDIIGEHHVLFGGMGETLEISHRAQSRETFARGSIRAAQWVVGQPSGLYDMQDVLGLRHK